MPTDRVLIAVETVANTAGIQKAQLAMLGMSGTAVALGAILGGVVLVTRNMIDISERHERAQKNLAQAYKVSRTNLATYQPVIDKFINANREYIPDQAAVIEGFATLTRSGLTQTKVQRDMAIAVNLAALKHWSLADAVTFVNNVEHGRYKGLVQLGIATDKYVLKNGKLVKVHRTNAEIIAELKRKTDEGAKSLTADQKATQALGNDWEKFATGPGAELGRAFTNAKEILDLFMQLLFALGNNNALWGPLQNQFILFGEWVQEFIIDPIVAAHNNIVDLWGGDRWSMPLTPGSSQRGKIGKGGKASGGPVYPGGVYTVGERGPETLVMGGQGGRIIPNGGRGGMTILPVVFSPIPPSREQLLFVREQLRRFDREQR